MSAIYSRTTIKIPTENIELKTELAHQAYLAADQSDRPTCQAWRDIWYLHDSIRWALENNIPIEVQLYPLQEKQNG